MQLSFISKCSMPRLFMMGLLMYFSLFAFNVLTRTADYTDPDTMNFVDVAENIKAGKGISQSTLGFNMPRFDPADPIPAPMTAQPPLYPLLIALVACTGISSSAAGLLISIVCYFLTMLFCYRLCRHLFDDKTALFAIACLLLYEPLRSISATTFSEGLGLMLLCGSLLVLLRIRRFDTRINYLIPFLAGLLVGLTFITRYALAPLVCVGGFFVLIEFRRKVASCLLYVIGFMIPAGWVWVRNYSLIGSIMPEPNPSNVGFITNVGKATRVLLRQSPDSLPSAFETLFITLAVLISLVVLIKRRRLVAAAKALMVKNGSYLIPLFCAGYMAFLILQRTRVHFDHINWRLVIPVGVLLTIWAAAFVMFETKLSKKYTSVVAGFILLFAIGRESYVMAMTPPTISADTIEQSQRLSWVEKNTDPEDLIIGMNSVDVVHYLDYPAVISFSAYPYCDYWTHEKLLTIAREKSHYNHIYLFVPKGDKSSYKRLYGDFFNALIHEEIAFKGITLSKRLEAETVFEISVSP